MAQHGSGGKKKKVMSEEVRMRKTQRDRASDLTWPDRRAGDVAAGPVSNKLLAGLLCVVLLCLLDEWLY